MTGPCYQCGRVAFLFSDSRCSRCTREEPSTLYNRVREPEPDYTHALHGVACQEAAKRHQVLVQHVLARKGQLVYCAVIKAPYSVPGGPDCWTVETIWSEKARLTVACKNVIACDSAFCSCRPAPAPVSEPVLEVTCL